MTDIKRIDTSSRFSEAVIYNGIVYLAGQVPTPDAINSDAETQTRSTLAEIDKFLEKSSSHKSRILSATVYLTDFSSYDGMNKAWIEWLPEGCAPARATIGNVTLAKKEWLLEIQVIAAINNQ